MAKVNSFLQIVGTIDGITYYFYKGKYLCRKARGFTSESIKTNPNLIKVRQNGSEFGALSKLAKTFRLCIQPYIGCSLWPELPPMVVKQFSAVKKTDVISERGQRNFATGLTTPEGRALMTGYSISPKGAGPGKLHNHLHLDPATGLVTFEKSFQRHNPFSLTAGFRLQFGFIYLDDSGTQFQLLMQEPTLISAGASLPTTVQLQDALPDSSCRMLVLSFQSLTQEAEGRPDSPFYFEVVSVVP